MGHLTPALGSDARARTHTALTVNVGLKCAYRLYFKNRATTVLYAFDRRWFRTQKNAGIN